MRMIAGVGVGTGRGWGLGVVWTASCVAAEGSSPDWQGRLVKRGPIGEAFASEDEGRRLVIKRLVQTRVGPGQFCRTSRESPHTYTPGGHEPYLTSLSRKVRLATVPSCELRPSTPLPISWRDACSPIW